MTTTERLHLRMAPDAIELWRAVATRLGFVGDRGPMQGVGSVSRLLEAVAASEVAVSDLADALAVACEDLVDGLVDVSDKLAAGAEDLSDRVSRGAGT